MKSMQFSLSHVMISSLEQRNGEIHAWLDQHVSEKIVQDERRKLMSNMFEPWVQF
jgi:hypothetical protein